MRDAVELAFKKLYTLGALFTLGALWFTLIDSETVYTGWDVFIITVVGAVGWPIVWGGVVANILNTFVGG